MTQPASSSLYPEFRAAVTKAMDGKSQLDQLPRSTQSGEEHLPAFGHSLKNVFGIAHENRSINFGSYGCPALPSLAARIDHTLRIDRDTDSFMRNQLWTEMEDVFNKCANFVGLEAAASPWGDVFLCENAGWAINASVRMFASPLWQLHVLKQRASAGVGTDNTIRILKFSNAYPTVHTSLENVVANNKAQFEIAELFKTSANGGDPHLLIPRIEVVVCTIMKSFLGDEQAMVQEIVECAVTGLSTERREELKAKGQKTAEEWVRSGETVRPVDAMICDHVHCLPGLCLPLAKIAKTVRKAAPNIIVAADGAHALGSVHLDFSSEEWRLKSPSIDASKEGKEEWVFDVYWSNCHKWLQSPKSSALLCVSKRVMPFFHATVIANFYRGEESVVQKVAEKNGAPTTFNGVTANRGLRLRRVKELVWQGTKDFTNDLCIPAAMEFRKLLGGEDRIIRYTTDLAYQGALVMAKIWGTKLVVEDPRRLSTIVSLYAPAPMQKNTKLLFEISNEMLSKHKTFAPIALVKLTRTDLPGGGLLVAGEASTEFVAKDEEASGLTQPAVCFRVAAQVYNEISDFEYFATKFLEVMNDKLATDEA